MPDQTQNPAPALPPDLHLKLTRLAQILTAVAQDRRFALAYSGGLDSRFLAHFAAAAGLRPLLLHVSGPHLAHEETQAAILQAEQAGLDLQIVEFNPLNLPQLLNNPPDRCYHCKKQIMTLLRQAAPSLPLCDGSNFSDKGGYRPGLAALQELGVLSPLLQAGLEKSEIRAAARHSKLPNPDQPASPCLLTRFPYQTELNLDLLEKVAELEAQLCKILQELWPETKLPEFRVRLVNGAWELHLPAACQPFAQSIELITNFKDLLPQQISGMRFLDGLSGFFDA